MGGIQYLQYNLQQDSIVGRFCLLRNKGISISLLSNFCNFCFAVSNVQVCYFFAPLIRQESNHFLAYIIAIQLPSPGVKVIQLQLNNYFSPSRYVYTTCIKVRPVTIGPRAQALQAQGKQERPTHHKPLTAQTKHFPQFVSITNVAEPNILNEKQTFLDEKYCQLILGKCSKVLGTFRSMLSFESMVTNPVLFFWIWPKNTY